MAVRNELLAVFTKKVFRTELLNTAFYYIKFKQKTRHSLEFCYVF